MSPDFLAVGHVTRDLMAGGFQLGGAALYSVLTASRLGLKAALATSAGQEVRLPRGQFLRRCLKAPETTTFKNAYYRGQRQQWLYARAGPLTLQAVPRDWREAPLVHLAPVAGEVAHELASAFPGALLAVTPQGWMRLWDKQGRVHPKPWEEASAVLPHATVVVFSEEDLTNGETLVELCVSRVPVVVVTQGERGARLHWKGTWWPVPAIPAQVVDPTGAGDVFAAALLIRFAETKDGLKAAHFASAAASLAIEAEGTEGLPTRAEVEERLKTHGLSG